MSAWRAARTALGDVVYLMGTAVGFLVGSFRVTSLYIRTRARERSLLARHYGWPLAFFMTLVWPNATEQYERVETHVLHGTPAEVLAFKQGVTDECQMTAIAGAIIAQVGITALSLDFLSGTHWTARAAFSISVSSGCLSVYYACSVQRMVGKLYNAEMARDWLMTAPFEADDESSKDAARRTTSLSAILTVVAPFGLVTISILAFLVGFMIYYGLLFTRKLDPAVGKHESRDTFICLITATGLCFFIFYISLSSKDVESMVVHRETVKYFKRYNVGGSSAPQTAAGDIEMTSEPATDQTSQQGQRALIEALREASIARARAAEADHAVADIYRRMSTYQPSET